MYTFRTKVNVKQRKAVKSNNFKYVHWDYHNKSFVKIGPQVLLLVYYYYTTFGYIANKTSNEPVMCFALFETARIWLLWSLLWHNPNGSHQMQAIIGRIISFLRCRPSSVFSRSHKLEGNATYKITMEPCIVFG